jgi:sulfide dehydrogenase cytochrome subunit
MSRILQFVLASCLFLSTTTFAAVDPTLIQSCANCHGAKGLSHSQEVPTISGVSPPVQVQALKAFKARTRPCTQVSYTSGGTQHHGDMCEVASKLSSADITALANYFSKLPFVRMKQPFNSAQAAAGKAIHDRDCEICHSSGGSDPTDDAGLLAGQPATWLKNDIMEYRGGKASESHVMQDKIARLSDTEIDALIQFYASEQ